MDLGCALAGFEGMCSLASRRGIGSERAGDLAGRGEWGRIGRH